MHAFIQKQSFRRKPKKLKSLFSRNKQRSKDIKHLTTASEIKSCQGLACSKRSDSGERCGVKKAMKSRGGLGREVSPLLLPRFYFFALLFTSHRSPLSERLEQAKSRINLAWENSRHFAMPPLISPEDNESRKFHTVDVPYPDLGNTCF